MPQSRPRSEPPPGGTQPQEADVLRQTLRSPGYLKLLLFCALISIPVSLASFWFLAGLHKMEHVMWADLPKALGWDVPPWWWPFPLLLVAGIVVGLVVTHMRGNGGHLPAAGLHMGGASASYIPGVVIAAVASLPLGAVLGPEAPLIALGGGLALLFRNLAQAPVTPQGTALVGAAGAAAAISTIFGNPLIAAVLLIEVAGVGGPQLFAVMLPSLLSAGVGDLVFTGLGRWTGLPVGSLKLDLGVPVPHLDAPDVLWAVVIAAAVAVALHQVLTGARYVAAYVLSKQTVLRTVQCALAAAACAALYALITGRSPAEIAGSGQSTIGTLASDPHAWGVGALIGVLLFKGAGYAICLGSLRGGPIFPALCLGAVVGVLLGPLPGLGTVPAMGAGMAATAASALRLPVSSVVMVVLMLGGTAMIPVVIIAAVVAFVVTELLPVGPPIPELPAVPRVPAEPAEPAAK
ncbi:MULTISPECIES: chloride channel protein [unclassified Streptomyces]|uniref:chloride channel protein n=1 Tax=unclassified Streptomyces TaxID=2593676 RepID=UPI00068FE0C2|nr:chloride channel protein [Streptomyces sp. NRRL S-241]